MPENNPSAGLENLVDSFQRSFRLEVGGVLPFEGAVKAVAEWAGKHRDTMDEDLQRRADLVLVQSMEDLHFIWRRIWVRAGVLPEVKSGEN
jgi:hypothetical protein